jgi:hypothetical protein
MKSESRESHCEWLERFLDEQKIARDKIDSFRVIVYAEKEDLWSQRQLTRRSIDTAWGSSWSEETLYVVHQTVVQHVAVQPRSTSRMDYSSVRTDEEHTTEGVPIRSVLDGQEDAIIILTKSDWQTKLEINIPVRGDDYLGGMGRFLNVHPNTKS